MPKRSNKQSDAKKIAAQIVEAAMQPTNLPAKETPPQKNPAAVTFGRLGDKEVGPARAEKFSPKKRQEIAQKAAAVRWAKKISTPRTFK